MTDPHTPEPLGFRTLKIAGGDAIRLLSDYRLRYPATRQYPFLIGDGEELSRLREAADFDKPDPATIIQASLDVRTAEWIERRRAESAEFSLPLEELLGEWPGEVTEKGSIGRDPRAVALAGGCSVWRLE